MTDLERFVRQLVRNLAAAGPDRLRQPLTVGDVWRAILPYRLNRRTLQLDTSEDYELVLMRLCAGEGGFAQVEPEEARAAFEQELRSPNPDLGVLRRQESAVLSLAPEVMAAAATVPPVRPAPATSPAPPAKSAHSVSPIMAAPAREPAEPSTGVLCAFCGGALPTDRPVNFCPHCGQGQTQGRCPECGEDIQRGWRYCAHCGTAVERAEAPRRRAT